VVGKSIGHGLAQMMVDVGNMTPAQWIQSSTMMFGTAQQKRSLEEWRQIETGEPSYSDF
jgi:hypothetical protein